MKHPILAAACAFLLSTGLSAAEPVAHDAHDRQLTQQVNKHVTMPISGPAAHLDGVVEVTLEVDSTGHLRILHIGSDQPALREHVLAKLAKVRLGSAATVARTTSFRFIFRGEA